jgi:tetratricopeptide (TPR) repeat protein
MGEYEIVLDQNPKHGWANYGLALILLRNKKQYELAVKKFRNAIESGSVKTANLYLNLARALLQTQKPDCTVAAREAYEIGECVCERERGREKDVCVDVLAHV